MFDTLSRSVERAWKLVSKDGKLTPENVKEPLKEIRRALLEADVSLPVVRRFVKRVEEKALGQEVGVVWGAGRGRACMRARAHGNGRGCATGSHGNWAAYGTQCLTPMGQLPGLAWACVQPVAAHVCVHGQRSTTTHAPHSSPRPATCMHAPPLIQPMARAQVIVGVTPDMAFIKTVSDELVELMGSKGAKDLEQGFPQIILMAGLQVGGRVVPTSALTPPVPQYSPSQRQHRLRSNSTCCRRRGQCGPLHCNSTALAAGRGQDHSVWQAGAPPDEGEKEGAHGGNGCVPPGGHRPAAEAGAGAHHVVYDVCVHVCVRVYGWVRCGGCK